MKRVLRKYFLLLLTGLQMVSYGFEHTIMLQKDAFEESKYKFSIVEVIDGRLNKQKPSGYFCKDFSTTKELIGNDSLAEQLNLFFKNNRLPFDTSTKIILVINQVNIGESRAKDYDDFIIKLSLDYYKVNGEKCALYFQQFTVFKGSVKMSKRKAVNRVFTNAMTAAFSEFGNQLQRFKTISETEINISELRSSLAVKPPQQVSATNIKDGLYFSLKDLYLNNPSPYKDYLLADTNALNKDVVSFASKNYYLKTVYSIVRKGRIYIYIHNYFYKEAFLSEDGKLFFEDVTQESISPGARTGSAAVGIFGTLASVFIPGGGGIVRAAATGATIGVAQSVAQQSIRKSGTTRVTSDIIIDYETGNLIPNKP